MKLSTILISLMLVTACAPFIAAQDGWRSIESENFVQRRRAASKPGTKPRKVTYQYVRQVPTPWAKRTFTIPPRPGRTKVTTEIGVTFWRLRPPRSGQEGFLFPVCVGNNRAMWVSERADPESSFREDDPVRLAIESTTPGYLYLFTREMNAGGKTGPPMMLFPLSDREYNYLQPGVQFDFPDRREECAYKQFRANNDGYEGDIITVVISPKPIRGFKFSRDNDEFMLLNPAKLLEIERNAETELFVRTDNGDRFYTSAEAESACGAKVRGLATPAANCSTGRGLAKDGPLPQSIYRVRSDRGKAAVAFVYISVVAKGNDK